MAETVGTAFVRLWWWRHLHEKLQQLLHEELPAIAKALGSQKNLPQQKQQQQQQQAYQMHLTPLPDASTMPLQLIESLASLQQQAKAFQDEFAKEDLDVSAAIETAAEAAAQAFTDKVGPYGAVTGCQGQDLKSAGQGRKIIISFLSQAYQEAPTHPPKCRDSL